MEESGWRLFVITKFPSISISAFWKDATHALTTLSRNLDRRAFIADDLEPRGQIHCLPDSTVQERWLRPRGQTMGYQAVLDSYEEWTANDWSTRKSVVAWGAGAELVLKVTDRELSTGMAFILFS